MAIIVLLPRTYLLLVALAQASVRSNFSSEKKIDSNQTEQCTFVSFFSSGFNTAKVVNPPERIDWQTGCWQNAPLCSGLCNPFRNTNKNYNGVRDNYDVS